MAGDTGGGGGGEDGGAGLTGAAKKKAKKEAAAEDVRLERLLRCGAYEVSRAAALSLCRAVVALPLFQCLPAMRAYTPPLIPAMRGDLGWNDCLVPILEEQ